MQQMETSIPTPGREPSALLEPTDEELLGRIAVRRDGEAFTRLFERYHERAFILARLLTAQESIAQDVVQEAFLALWQNAWRYDSAAGSSRAWILGVVANKAFYILRRSRNERVRESREGDRFSSLEPVSPERGLQQEEMRVGVRKMLDRLPVSLRQVLALHYAGEMSHKRIARALGIPQSTIALRIRQGLEEMRRRLMEAGYLAALPLAGADRLGEILLAAAAVPPQNRLQAWGRLEQAIRAPARKPLQLMLAGPAALSLAVIVAGLGGLLLWPAAQSDGTPARAGSGGAELPARMDLGFVSDPASPHRAAGAPLSHSEEGKGSPREDGSANFVQRHWTFEKGPPGDLEVRDGRWRWDGKNLMVADAQVMLLLPEPLPPKPFLVQLRMRMPSPGKSMHGVCWSDGDSILPFRRYTPGEFHHQAYDQMTLFHEYFIGTYQVLCQDAKVFGICEETGNASTTRLCLGLKRLELKEVLVRTIEEREIPSDWRDPQALIARLGWPVESYGAQHFPPRLRVNR